MQRKRSPVARSHREHRSKRSRTSSPKENSRNWKLFESRKGESRCKSYSAQERSTHHDKKSSQCSSTASHVVDTSRENDESPELQQPNDESPEQQQPIHDVAETCKDVAAKSVLPTRDEIDAGDNYHLKPNTVDQPYSSVDEYVSIHFNLLKEDYLRPLRRAVSYARDVLSGDVQKDDRTTDVRMYPNVRVIQAFCGRERGILFEIKFRRILLDEKSLMQNSLVLLSKDKFKTFSFGTVEMRIQSGSGRNAVVAIGLKPMESEGLEIFRDLRESGKPFDMLETTAFFYMTSQALEGLRAIASEQLEGKRFPFCEHIVLGKSTDDLPPYIQQLNNWHRGLDISCIMECATPKQAVWHNTGDELWPETSVRLNEMQYKAFRHAFSHPLALIQGPPGTGKTFMGVLIVSTILRTFRSVMKEIKNTTRVAPWEQLSDFHVRRQGDIAKSTLASAWSDSAKNAGMEAVGAPNNFSLELKRAECLANNFGPIMVVCYKNHALDQFLSNIIRQDPEIVRGTGEAPGVIRVGGGCKDESLSHLLLHSCSKRYCTEVDKKMTISKRRYMGSTDQKLKNINLRMRILSDSIVTVKSLSLAIDNTSLSQLASGTTEYSDGLHKWLFVDFPDDFELQNRQEALNRTSDRNHRANDMLFSNTIQSPAMYSGPQFCHVHEVQDLLRDDEIENFRWVAQKARKNRAQLSPCDVEKLCEKYPNIWHMPPRHRWDRYYAWTEQCKQGLEYQIRPLEESYITCANQLKLLLQEQDCKILKKAKIIAMTTTSAAKYRPLLQRVAPRVVVIEEAAEVLESHTITALSEHTEHVIMIGDHQQLRPASHDYELGKSHKLTCSLFERLVNVKVPFETLNVQHRMRPEISALIVPEIYTSLVDHTTVEDRSNVRGMQKNVFFVNHTHYEAHSPDSTSRANEFEEDMVCCLALHLVKQGYRESEITILSTYESQRELIRKRVDKMMPRSTKSATNTKCSQYAADYKDGQQQSSSDEVKEATGPETVKVTTVDNYQGEENKIVILSLVRSNKNGDIGYVKDKLRICVMLSRARDGLYVIGNLQQMKAGSGLWRKILKKASASGLVGNYIPIQCPNEKHSDHKMSIFKWSDIARKSPQGGCRQRCEVTKECGHVCDRLCHGHDSDHSLPCLLPCAIRCQNNHICMLKCWENCEPCQVIITIKACRCNHDQAIECHLSDSPPPCTARIFTTLRCGHTTTKQCGEVDAPMCEELCDKQRSCGHTCSGRCAECFGNCVQLPCQVLCKVELPCGHMGEKKCSAAVPPCKDFCDAELQCGHICKNLCDECFNGRIHGECMEMCTKMLICGHEKDYQRCHELCQPCDLPCIRQCKHALCKKRCGELCDVCSKKCKKKTTHLGSHCSRLCFEPCNSLKRGKNCHEKFPCGHQCRGVRGLSCPGTCKKCRPSSVEDDRFIELECGHRFEVLHLDKKLSGQSSSDQTAIQFLQCPYCKMAIDHPRYRNADVTKQARKDLETVKRKLFELQDVEEDIINANNAARLVTGLNKLLENVTILVTFVQEDNLKKLQTEVTRMAAWIEEGQFLTKSQLNDIMLELRRLGVWYNAAMIHRGGLPHDQSKMLSRYLEKLRLCNRVKLEDLEEMKKLCCDLAATSTSITVSWEHEVTLEEIPDAQHSSWLKCSKGHIYYEGVSRRIAGKIGCSECGENP